jgi:hypothetical protein
MQSGPAELENHFRQLRRRRIHGYIEVDVPHVESPQLTIGFRLAGDGTVPDDAYVQVPVMDELARFTGDVVLDVHRAWDLVRAFIHTGQAGEFGEWHAL